MAERTLLQKITAATREVSESVNLYYLKSASRLQQYAAQLGWTPPGEQKGEGVGDDG